MPLQYPFTISGTELLLFTSYLFCWIKHFPQLKKKKKYMICLFNICQLHQRPKLPFIVLQERPLSEYTRTHELTVLSHKRRKKDKIG